MENRSSRVVALVALVVAVVGLGIGFAAFTSTLTISSTATVTPTDTFQGKVFFTADKTTTEAGAATVVDAQGKSSAASINDTALKLTVDADGLVAPGDTAVYNLHVYNASPYNAKVTSLEGGVVQGCDTTYPTSNEANALANAACKALTVTVTGMDVGTTIASETYADITVTVTYPAGAALTDQNLVDVAFSDIVATYTTVQ